METLTGNTFYFDFEVALMEWIQSVLGPTGSGIVSALSTFGEEFFLIILLAFTYWCYDKKFGEHIGSIIILGCIINPLIKFTWLEGTFVFFLSHKNDTFNPIDLSLSPCNQNSSLNNSTHFKEILNNFVLWAKSAECSKKSNKLCCSSNFVFSFPDNNSNLFHWQLILHMWDIL